MATADVHVFRWGRERARTGPWRGDRRTAYVAPLPDGPVLSADFVRRCVDHLAAGGYTRVVTGALAPHEQHAFLAVGFGVEEHLHLLSHDLRTLPAARTKATLRRANSRDHAEVLTVDAAAFSPFWQLDRPGLLDAIRATPSTRFEVAEVDGRVVGYAVTGRAGRRGYLQRLAVRPDHRREGIGSALAVDGLRWLRRWRVEVAVVNTQDENAQALDVYERLGFRRLPQGLSVLSAGLGDRS